jgi:hypothetical protein
MVMGKLAKVSVVGRSLDTMFDRFDATADLVRPVCAA